MSTGQFSRWSLLQDGNRVPFESDAHDLPFPRYGVYILGIKSNSGPIRTVYVGSATSRGGLRRRLMRHRGRKTAGEWISNKGHHIDRCVRRGMRVYFRFRYTSSVEQAKRLEKKLLLEWWKYPWNDQFMPWFGASASFHKAQKVGHY